MTSARTGGATRGAGGAGPEQNLHIDHDAATGDDASRLDQVKAAASGSATSARESVANIAAQIRETVGDTYSGVREGVRDAYEAGTDRIDHYRTRGVRAASRGQDTAERFVSENPLLVGVLGLAAGLLLGSLLPRTRREDQAIGRWANDARDEGLRYARAAAQRGREMVDETIGDVREGVQAANEELKDTGGRGGGASGRYQNH